LDTPQISAAILALAAEMGRTHPKMGWDDVKAETGFDVTIMAMTGNAGGNFVECLASVGLERDDVVDAFVLAKPRLPGKQRGAAAKGAVAAPVAALAPASAPVAPPAAVPVPNG
jgi:hypothetical protein